MRRLFFLPWRSGRRIDADVDEELRFQLQARATDLVALGWTPASALAQAEREFGDLGDARRYLRAIDRDIERRNRRHDVMGRILRDVTFGVRTLRTAPVFAATAVLTLGLGIGATSAVFSVVYAALFRPLPFPAAHRIVAVFEAGKEGAPVVASPPNFMDFRARNSSLTGLAAIDNETRTLTGAGDPQPIDGAFVTEDFFRVMGVSPRIGRAFTSDEAAYGHQEVAVLSDGLWRTAFGARPDIIGASIQLDGKSAIVIGVMPPGFSYPDKTRVWSPLAFDPATVQTQRGAHYLNVVGRLRPGVSLDQSRADLNAVAQRLAVLYPLTNKDGAAAVMPLRDTLIGATPKRALVILLGAVGLVILIACANVANLMLARGAGRRVEIAVRVAMGAGPRDLMQMTLTESLVLAVSGGVLGVGLSILLARVMSTARPQALRAIGDIAVDPAVLVFTACVVVCTAVLFGMLPALQALKWTGIHDTLRAGGRGGTGGHTAGRTRSVLVACELALSVVLLVGAGLLIKTFSNLQSVARGYTASGAVTFGVSLPPSRYPKPENAALFYDQLLARIGTLNGVTGAGGTSLLPLQGDFYISVDSLDGRVVPQADRVAPQVWLVTPRLFSALGMRVVRGRPFLGTDRIGAPRVAIVNEAAAKLLWPNEDPIGRSLEVGTRFGLGLQHGGGLVVGVVRNIHDAGPGMAPRPTVYLPHAQFPVGDLSMVVRLSNETLFANTIKEVRSAIGRLDPLLPMMDVKSLREIDAQAVAQPRFIATLLIAFALLAFILSIVGVYGVMNYLVGQRRREFGIRIALGASGRSIISTTLASLTRPVIAGLSLGIAGAAVLSLGMRSLLFEVTPTDPALLVGVPAALLAVVLVAALIPARRARAVDPVMALRQE